MAETLDQSTEFEQEQPAEENQEQPVGTESDLGRDSNPGSSREPSAPPEPATPRRKPGRPRKKARDEWLDRATDPPEAAATVECQFCGDPSTRSLSWNHEPDVFTADLCAKSECEEAAFDAHAEFQKSLNLPEPQESTDAGTSEEREDPELPVFDPEVESLVPVLCDRPLPLPPEGLRWTATGMVIPENLTWEQWVIEGYRLNVVGRGVMWALGDYLNYGERKYGQEFAQQVDSLGFALQTAKNAMSICSAVPPEERRTNPKISYSHHAEVAYVKDRKIRDKWLDLAEENNWSVKEFRAAINAAAVKGKSPVDLAKAPTARQVQKTITEFAEQLGGWTLKVRDFLPKAEQLHDLVEVKKMDKALYDAVYADILVLRDQIQELVIDGNDINKFFE